MENKPLLYEHIKDCILSQIGVGDLAIHSQLPPVHELQKTFSCSHITILHALKDLRESEVIERHGRGYRICRQYSNDARRPNLDDSDYPVGLFIRPVRPHSSDNYFNEINLVIENELSLARRYWLRSPSCHIFNYKPVFSPGECQDILRNLLMMDSRCCGMLLDERIPDCVLEKFLEQKHRPVLLLNRSTSLPITTISIPAKESARLLWNKASLLGYQEIILNTFSNSCYFNCSNFFHACQSLDESGEFSQLHFHSIDSSFYQSNISETDLFSELFNQYRKIKKNGKVLFLFRSNVSAHRFISYMKTQNCLFNRDYGICGFYLPQDPHTPYQLNTVRVNTEAIGRLAVQTLLNTCNQPTPPHVEKLDAPLEFILGDTM